METIIAIYDSIKFYAKEKNVSINEIETKTGLSSGSLCKWNEVSPSVNSLKKVADYLEIPIGAFLEHEHSVN